MLLPLLGPVFFNGMIAGVISSVALSPLVNLAWRQRKYMADATAALLTRDPDSLDAALVTLAASDSAVQMPAWAAHLCILEPTRSAAGGSLLRKTFVSMFPPPRARHRALCRLGANNRELPGAAAPDSWPLRVSRALLFSVFALITAAVLGAIACAYCLSLIMTLFPIAMLHAILR